MLTRARLRAMFTRVLGPIKIRHSQSLVLAVPDAGGMRQRYTPNHLRRPRRGRTMPDHY